jgi:hypothetical protein
MSDNKPSISLKSLLVPSKELTIEYPGAPGFEVKLCYLSKETMINLRKKATTTKIRAGRELEEKLDDELFQDLFVSATLKGWTGLQYKYLATMVAVDLSGIENLEDTLEYTKDNALMLMRSSSDFDNWIASVVGDLGNFQKSK